MSKRKFGIFILAILVLGAFGYAGYCFFAQKEISDGKAAFKNAEWSTAFQHFERVINVYKFGLFIDLDEIETLRKQSGILTDAQTKFEQGKYEAALDAYDSYTKLYSESAKQLNVSQKSSEVYAKWFEILFQDHEYEKAQEKSQLLFNLYPKSTGAIKVRDALPTFYMAWGADLRKSGQFQQAIEKYEIVLKEFPGASSEKAVNPSIAETYLEWGKSLVKNGQYELALEKFNTILTDTRLKRTPSIEKVSTEVASTILVWAQSLEEKGEYEKEITLLKTLLSDHRNSPEADQADQMIFNTHHLYGQQLIKDNHFLLAIQIYKNSLEYSKTKETQTLADSGTKIALDGLTNDKGQDGQKVIADTLITACAGKPAKLPIIGITKTKPAKGLACTNDISLPPEWKATTPGNFLYAINIEKSTAKIQTCPYSRLGFGVSTNFLVRVRRLAKISVHNAITGAVIKTETLYGPYPNYCPPTYWFGSTYENLYGDYVSSDVIVAWLKRIFK